MHQSASLTARLLSLLGVVVVAACGGGGGGAAAPALLEVSPSQGPTTGGTVLTLRGANLVGDVRVTVGESEANDLEAVDASTCTCLSPPGPPGSPVAVEVTTEAGRAVLPAAFRYRPVPTLTSITPSVGGSGGGTAITLSGSGFEGGITSITLDGQPAADIVVLDDATCTCHTPAVAQVGAVDAVLTTAGGSVVLPQAFTYDDSPTLRGVEPDSGFEGGGATLTLRGSGFTPDGAGEVSVEVGGATSPAVHVLNEGILTAVLPAGEVGQARVLVRSAEGEGALPEGFTYFSYPPRFLASDTRLDRDAEGEARSSMPAVACNGSDVYVVWQDDRNGQSDIYFNRSSDGGTSWLPRDVRLDTDAPGAWPSLFPCICCNGKSVHVAWEDGRNGKSDIYSNSSSDGGSTWLATDRRIDTDSVGVALSNNPRICCDGSDVHVLWADNRGAAGGSFSIGVYYNRSIDGGKTWLASDLRLDTGAQGEPADPAARLTCDGPYVYAVWHASRESEMDIRFNRSTDGGATWLASDVRLDTDVPRASASLYPEVCCAGMSAYVAWFDARNVDWDIFFTCTHDAGTSWLEENVRLDTDGAGADYSSGSRICCDGDAVYVAWKDDRSGATDIRFNRSLDGGTTWLAGDVRVNADAGPDASHYRLPEVGCDGTNVYVVWEDVRNGARDIYFNCSSNGGTTWLTSDVRLDTDTRGAASSEQPRMACDGARVFVVWQDARNGEADILTNSDRP